MPHKDNPHPAWANDALLRLIRVLASLLMVGVGVSLLATGYDKLAANPYFANMLSWFPWWLWGVAPVIFGVLSLFRNHTVQMVGYALSAAYLWLYWSATTSAVFAPDSNVVYTGIPPWTAAAIALTALAVSSWAERRDTR